VRKPSLDYVPIVVIGVTLTTLLVLTLFLVNRESSGAVAADAEVAILAESTLSAAAGAVNATNFAVVLAVNTADQGLIDEARAGAEGASDELTSRSARLVSELTPDLRNRVVDAQRRFGLATEGALADLETLDEATGSAALAEQAGTYQSLVEELAALRDTRTAEILVAGEGVGRAANAVRFLVVFLLPTGIMIAVWKAIRRNAAQRILTEELRHLKDESRSKDQFIADVSHELRTPLTGIYGFASELEDAGEDLPESSRELVGFIVSEAAELSRMVDDLVAAGRIDAQAITYDLEPVKLWSEIQEVVRPFRRRGISVEVDDIAIAVLADRMRLGQVLRNLVSNAAKHGGEEIAVTAYSRGDSAVIEVIDDGPGVSDEIGERLFDRYMHRDGAAVVEGSVGLGLAIARSFAEGMGGSLQYLRVDGLTIFEVTLPLPEVEDHAVPEPEFSVVSL
jgi:signal transduction histidine kinase